MKRTLGVVLGLVLLTPFSAQSQDWTPEQSEVWVAMYACWEAADFYTWSACVHDDYVGWGTNAVVPQNKADILAPNARWFETMEQVYLYLKPLDIKVHGNVAILTYVANFVERNKATGEETSSTVKWTDIMLKDGEKWKWLSDHGTVVEEG
jgi:hypothetical protein